MSRPVAVVTGAARGIGAETAKRLAATHRVALLDLDADGTRQTCGEVGRDAVWVACDTADATAVREAVADVVERCGGIDVAIANAGVATSGALRHLDPAVLAAALNVNLVGSWRFLHACLPHVIERRGYLLGVASAAAVVPPPGLGPYAASKAGLEQLLNVLRVEVAHLGVAVGVALFSWVDTEMVRGGERRHPAFAQLRRRLRGPATGVMPLSAAADAIVGGVHARRRYVIAPRTLAAGHLLRGLIGPLVEREGRRHAAAIDAATAQLVAERDAFAAGLGADARAAEAAARTMHADAP